MPASNESFSTVGQSDVPRWLRTVLAISLGGLLSAAILLRWVPGRWINPSLFEAGVALLAVVWGAYMAVRPFKVYLSFALIPLAAAVGWPILQLITNQTVSRWETENAAILWAGNFLVALFALQLGSDARSKRRLLQYLATFAFLISVVSLLGFFSSPNQVLWIYETGFNDVFGPFVSRDRYAAFAELVMPLCVFLGLRERRLNLMWVGMAAAIFAAVIAGASRAGAILIVFEGIVLLIVAVAKPGRASSSRIGGTFAIFAIAAVIFTAAVGIGTLAGRFDDKDPYAGRREMLESSIDMIKERPLVGFGLGNFPNAYPKYSRFDTDKFVNHAHNDWAEWGVDGGVPFVVFMLALAIWVLPRAYRSIWGVGILIVLMHSFVDFPLQDPAIEFWLFALVGLLGAPLPQLPKGDD